MFNMTEWLKKQRPLLDMFNITMDKELRKIMICDGCFEKEKIIKKQKGKMYEFYNPFISDGEWNILDGGKDDIKITTEGTRHCSELVLRPTTLNKIDGIILLRKGLIKWFGVKSLNELKNIHFYYARKFDTIPSSEEGKKGIRYILYCNLCCIRIRNELINGMENPNDVKFLKPKEKEAYSKLYKAITKNTK